jgi:hypothetical protein
MVFPAANIAEDDRSDYRFCANIARERVSQAIALRVSQINYSSLNDAVGNDDRGFPYDRVYSTMLEEQINRYGGELDLPTFIPSYDLEADPEVAATAGEH